MNRWDQWRMAFWCQQVFHSHNAPLPTATPQQFPNSVDYVFTMIVLCSSSFSNNVSNHCITMITFTTTCTSGLWGFTFTTGQIGSYWHRHCRHLTVLNWNDGGESKMFVKSSMWGLPSPIISSWHYKLHYWNPWSLSTATGAVGNTALVCIFVYRWGWNGCTY